MKKNENINYWSLSIDEALRYYKSSKEGLTSEEAAARLNEYGENRIRDRKKTSELMLFLNQFKNPIIIILIVATLISAATGEVVDSLIIFAIILASAILSFIQEYSAGNAIEELREKVQAKSLVLRDGNFIEIPANEIVIGDIVKLSTGSLVPADGLVIDSFDFFVNQSFLTGESLPVEKKSGPVPEKAGINERINCVYMGTSVHNGNALVLITKTGRDTEFGSIAEELNLRPPETEFERGVRHFGYLLTQIMLILTLAVFAINVFFNRPAIDSLIFSVALAVGITPQLLPAIISITLSKGSRIMAKSGVIVRRLNSIENFGSMDIMCTDKTGTLTEGVIRIDGAVNSEGQNSDDVLKLAYLNASLQTGMINSLDNAIINFKKVDISSFEKVGEIPFDFTRERLSVIVREKGKPDSKPIMIVKGALNNILNVCSYIEIQGSAKEKDDKLLNEIQKQYEKWSSEGIRVLGIAKKTVSLREKYTIEDEAEMVFAGFILLFDHPKNDVNQTINALRKNGVSLRVITGDNKLIAMHTAEAVGLEVEGVLTGEEIRELSDEALWNRVETTTLFAEVDPNQKERIILAFKKKSHVVGYMGDGINDLPAMHAADVSVSVDNAVDVAKSTADLVLLEKSLEALNRGIILGRTTFGNTLKYILVTSSANFGNMFSMAGASLILPFLPLLPKQILLINFLSDFPAITIAYDNVDADMLEKPRRWNTKFIKNFMIVFGLISSVFDYITFAVLFLGFNVHHNTFQSSWFIFSVITELLILMVMRTQKPFFKSKPAPALLYSSLFVGAFTLIIPYMPFHELLGIEPLSPFLLFILLLIAGFYVLITEIIKYHFYKSRLNEE